MRDAAVGTHPIRISTGFPGVILWYLDTYFIERCFYYKNT